MPKRKYQTPEVLHDAPLRDDGTADFHFDDFAATLARLIASPDTETPLAIGINGAWGSGKTSLLRRVRHMLDKPKGEDGKDEHRFADGKESFRKCKTVWFDAWKYNEENALLVALVRVILQEMKKDKLMDRLNAWFEDPNQPSYDSVAMFINAFEVSFGGLGLGLKFKADPQKHSTPSRFEQHTAFFDYFDEAFERLLNLWVHGKTEVSEEEIKKGALVIFIDDLDRCKPDKTVQTLEAIKLFLDKRGCVFVLGADTRIVQFAVETHYKNAGITGQNAKDYLEKVIQLRFDIPPILENAMENFVFSQSEKKVDADMRTRWRALVAAAEVNPRRVKNVINDLNLQWYMAFNSDQTAGVNRDDFICWQALLRAAPAAFVEQIELLGEQKDARHGFIANAVKWQQGAPEERENLKGFYSAYEGREAKRLREVLRQISFSAGFTVEALDALIYMTAPPAVVKPELEKAAAEKAKTPFRDVDVSKLPSEEQEAWLKAKLRDAGVRAAAAPELEIMEGAPAVLRERGEKGILRGDQNRLTIGGLDFMRVPQGKFVMGSKDDNELAADWEKPQHTVDIDHDYWMAKFILTNEQYAEFLGRKKHPVSDWQKKKNHPVVNVSWNDAVEYCKWFNETYQNELEEAGGLSLRLPAEAEWEKAARGAYGNEWPWGNEFDPNKCNSAEGRKGQTTPVETVEKVGESSTKRQGSIG